MNTSVKIGKITLKNPVMVASGTFGLEYKPLTDINSLGALVVKTITLNGRVGNPPPRIVETAAGILNSIGLENKGVDDFIGNKLAAFEEVRTNLIVSIAAETTEELKTIIGRLNNTRVDAIELNLSCPNVKREKFIGLNPATLIAQNREWTERFVAAARKYTKKTLMTKLSPNVTDITKIAKAAESGGSDAISLANTFLGMAVDIKTRMPKLGGITGGLSGPAIKPIVLRMVWEAFNKVKIPIIGIGGIIDYNDAVEFIICGSTAIQVGTANFINPKATTEIIDGIQGYLVKNKIKNIDSLIGSLKTK